MIALPLARRRDQPVEDFSFVNKGRSRGAMMPIAVPRSARRVLNFVLRRQIKRRRAMQGCRQAGLDEASDKLGCGSIWPSPEMDVLQPSLASNA